MTISKIDLLNRKFTKRVWGYAPEEVDQLLGEVAEMLGVVAEERKNLIKKVKRMPVSGKNTWVKCVAPFSMAQSFMFDEARS